MKDSDEYVVEEILADQKVWNKQKYLVKWKGWPKDDAMWEPEEHVADSAALDIYSITHAKATKGKSTKQLWRSARNT